jgi:hypothetical protein
MKAGNRNRRPTMTSDAYRTDCIFPPDRACDRTRLVLDRAPHPRIAESGAETPACRVARLLMRSMRWLEVWIGQLGKRVDGDRVSP